MNELRSKPKLLSGSNVLHVVKDIKNNWGRTCKRKRDGAKPTKAQNQPICIQPRKKKSVFFDLPYWDVSFQKNRILRISYSFSYCQV